MNGGINSVNDFFDFIKENSHQTRKRIFRGHESSNYNLIPGIGRVLRAELHTQFDTDAELMMLNSFKQKAYSYLKTEFSIIELLAIAQHHGLPTRMLDWTWNPLVATYFAVKHSSHVKDDGLIYYVDTEKFTFQNTNLNPFELKDVVLYNPIHITPRIAAQAGLFSIHPNPNESIEDSWVNKITISKNIKKDIEIILETMGIHHGSLFPGLDGMTKYVEWLYTSN